jgi:hypothetical protein
MAPCLETPIALQPPLRVATTSRSAGRLVVIRAHTQRIHVTYTTRTHTIYDVAEPYVVMLVDCCINGRRNQDPQLQTHAQTFSTRSPS